MCRTYKLISYHINMHKISVYDIGISVFANNRHYIGIIIQSL